MTASEWQDRSLEAAATRVNVAQERQEAVAAQYDADRNAEQADEPAGHQTKTVKSRKSAS